MHISMAVPVINVYSKLGRTPQTPQNRYTNNIIVFFCKVSLYIVAAEWQDFWGANRGVWGEDPPQENVFNYLP